MVGQPGFGEFARWLLTPPSPGELEALARQGENGGEGLGGYARERGPERGARDAGEALWQLLETPFEPRLVPYASVYRDGARFGPSLVAFRGFLRRWDLVPERGRFRDLEDHAGFQLDCLAYLGSRPEGHQAYRECLEEHVLPWLPRFLNDLGREDKKLPYGGFYGRLARLARGLIEAEAARLGLAVP